MLSEQSCATMLSVMHAIRLPQACLPMTQPPQRGRVNAEGRSVAAGLLADGAGGLARQPAVDASAVEAVAAPQAALHGARQVLLQADGAAGLPPTAPAARGAHHGSRNAVDGRGAGT